MIRKAASKFLILAAVTLASGAVAVNCSKKSDKDDIGSVGLALVLPGGGIVNTVNYTISGDGITPIMGTIDVSAPGTTQATALVSGLAPGHVHRHDDRDGHQPDPDLYGHGAVHGRRGPDGDGERHPAVHAQNPRRLGRHQRPD